MGDRTPRTGGIRDLPILRLFLEQAPEIRPLSLRFVDPATEAGYRVRSFRDSLPFIRFGHVMGIAVWAAFGLLATQVLEEGTTADLALRFGVAIPLVVVSLILTYASWYPRHWQPTLAIALLLNGFIWSTHRVLVPGIRADWAWAGLMIVLAFTYVLSREPFVYATVVGALLTAFHIVVTAVLVDDPGDVQLLGGFFLVVFATIGMAASYGLERSSRLLYLRERELDAQRRRADDLLLNTMPLPIVERLKAGDGSHGAGSIADGHAAVTVLFADLVGFTQRAGLVSPHELVRVLDGVFTRFDELADRLGMEKIKTVGDAYMAVAGAPQPRSDHAHAAVEMALAMLEALRDETWPTGGPMQVRIGIASGPAVAGVIGRRKFAYDLWGDTVNLASRLESAGEPGRILVAESTYGLLEGRYTFSDPCVLQLKGKGPTRAWFLQGRVEPEG
jgi:class 3 adenylate cyclase